MTSMPDIDEVQELVADETILVGGEPLHVLGYRPTIPLADPEIVFLYGVWRHEIAAGSTTAARAYALAILRTCDAAEGVAS